MMDQDRQSSCYLWKAGIKMKTIIVDDEPLVLKLFEIEAAYVPEIELIGSFEDPDTALAFTEKNKVDFAVLDVAMPGMNGIDLGKKLKERHPDIVLAYVTGYEQYAMDAYKLEAAAYLLKPFDLEQVKRAAKRAALLHAGDEKRVKIRTFGSFEVFVDGVTVHFHGNKVRELFALLVNKNGGLLTAEEAIALLWEDKPYDKKSQGSYRQLMMRLSEVLASYGVEDIIISSKTGKSIDRTKVECDYFRLLDGDSGVLEEFDGEYMTNYSWAEETLGMLVNRYRKYGSY